MAIFFNGIVYSNWEKVDSPQGGTITQIIFAENELVSLALNSGLYNYNFQNLKWNKINKSNDLLRLVSTFDIDTINSSTYVAIRNYGVFKSDDRINWIKIHSGKNINNTDIDIKKLKVYDNIVIFFSDNEIYLSSNYGQDWENINSNLPIDIFIYDFLIFESKIYLATNKGLVISENYGNDWNSIVFDGGVVYGIYNLNNRIIVSVLLPGIPTPRFQLYEKEESSDDFKIYFEEEFEDLQILGITGYKNNLSILTVQTSDKLYTYKIFLSKDNGSGWNEIKSLEYNNLEYFSNAIAMDNENIFIGTFYDGIYSINYESKNSTLLNDGLEGILTNSFFDDSKKVASSVNSGFYYKDDNKWIRSENSPLTIGINNNAYSAINEVIKLQNKYIAATNEGLYQSTDGKNWEEFDLLVYLILDLKIVDNVLYALGNFNSGYLFVSNDYGINWASKKLPNDAIALSYLIDGSNIFVGTHLGLMNSNDGGNSWVLINSTFTNTEIIRAITKQKNNTLLIHTSKNIYFSVDGGLNWVKSNNGLSDATINNLITIDNISIVATNLGTAFSYDYGINWYYSNNGLDSPNIRKLNSVDSLVYAFQTSGGIFKSNIKKLAPIKILNKIEKVLCNGTAFQVQYETNKDLIFNTGNRFLVQLSNKDGIFDDASKIVGEINSTIDGTISVIIPEEIIEGKQYRFRVISTLPEVVGIDNLEDITIVIKPQPIIYGTDTVCSNREYTYSVSPLSNSFQIKWSVSNGEIIGEDNKENVTVKWKDIGTAALSVTQFGTPSCTGEAELMVEVKPTPEKPIIAFDNGDLISNSDIGNQWYFEGNLIEEATQKVFKPTDDGNYTVVVINEYLCSSEFSDPFYFQNLSDKLILKVDTISSYTGDDAWVNVRLIKNEKFYELNVETLSFDLVSNASLIYPKVADKGVIIDGKRYLRIDADTNYISENIIMAIPMKVMLGNSDTTIISIQNLKINNQNYTDHLAINGMLYLLDVCYDGGPRLVTSDPYLKIERISPNPNIGNFLISIYSNEKQNTTVFLADVLGNKIEKIYEGMLDKGVNEIRYNANKYSGGDYYILAEGSNSNSIHKIIIAR